MTQKLAEHFKRRENIGDEGTYKSELIKVKRDLF